MPEKIFHWWRVLATGCCFSIFGEGGVVLRFVYFPLLHLVVWNTGRRVRLARSVIQSGFRIFVVVMQALGVLGADRAEIPALESDLVHQRGGHQQHVADRHGHEPRRRRRRSRSSA